MNQSAYSLGFLKYPTNIFKILQFESAGDVLELRTGNVDLRKVSSDSVVRTANLAT
jgi:hypothetical protein